MCQKFLKGEVAIFLFIKPTNLYDINICYYSSLFLSYIYGFGIMRDTIFKHKNKHISIHLLFTWSQKQFEIACLSMFLWSICKQQ